MTIRDAIRMAGTVASRRAMSALECAEQASSRACTVKPPHICALTTKAFFRKCQTGIARRVVVRFFRRGDLTPLQWALRMQAAVRQIDLVDQHVDAAQRTFDGVRVIHFDEDG